MQCNIETMQYNAMETHFCRRSMWGGKIAIRLGRNKSRRYVAEILQFLLSLWFADVSILKIGFRILRRLQQWDWTVESPCVKPDPWVSRDEASPNQGKTKWSEWSATLSFTSPDIWYQNCLPFFDNLSEKRFTLQYEPNFISTPFWQVQTKCLVSCCCFCFAQKCVIFSTEISLYLVRRKGGWGHVVQLELGIWRGREPLQRSHFMPVGREETKEIVLNAQGLWRGGWYGKCGRKDCEELDGDGCNNQYGGKSNPGFKMFV